LRRRKGTDLAIPPAWAYIPLMSDPAQPLTDDDTAAFLAAVREGLADADAGRTVPHDEVRRWILSWGTESELPPPECP